MAYHIYQCYSSTSLRRVKTRRYNIGRAYGSYSIAEEKVPLYEVSRFRNIMLFRVSDFGKI